MSWAISITLEGSPGIIQRIADAVDLAVPGILGWQDYAAESPAPGCILVRGTGIDPAVIDHSAAELQALASQTFTSA